MKIQVSELIVRFLERLGVERVFGIPGAHVLPLYDRLYDSAIATVLAKHEQGAAFMAGGYARVSGRVAACLATAGPGATNLVTGIANAYADRLPVLAITGETSTYIFGKGGLQESSGEGGAIDQCELFRPITRYAKAIERTDYLPQVLNRAAQVLLSPTPGPVLLSIPFNVQNESVDAAILDQILTDIPVHRALPAPEAIETLARLLRRSRQPAIVAGHGCLRSDVQGAVARLSEQWHIPVATSLKGKGVVDETGDLALGSLGVTSSGRAYQYLVEQADLILFLGAGFNERTSYLWDQRLLSDKRLIQVDRDPQQLAKVFRADLAIEGDVGQVIAQLLERLEVEGIAGNGQEARDYIQAMKATPAKDYAIFQSRFPLPEGFFTRLERRFPDGCNLFDDNIIFAQNFYRVPAGPGYFPNTGISSLGHALPAAIGARFADERPTFAILGDGGFQMCAMEIMTAVNYGRPLNIVVFNNATMGLIRKNQSQHYGQRFIDCDFVNPDFRLLAQAFDIGYLRVAREADLDRLFDTCDLEGAINLIEIPIDKNAFPNYSSKR